MDGADWAARLSSGALAWAFEGRKSFVGSLRVPEFRELYEKRITGEPVVLVYGASQVGKTELILRLLGLDLTAPALRHVKVALRGGRPEGSSASATATIYRRGTDEFFGFAMGDERLHGLSAEQMAERMADARAKVESGQWSASNPPVEVTIPSGYLGVSLFQNAAVSILDLPGVGSTTTSEHPHVEALLDRYAPIASVVILVFPAMHLPKLSSMVATDFADWRDETDRFRLVLTRAISPGNIQKSLDSDSRRGMPWLQSHYLDELAKTIVDYPSSLLPFPVEFGDSWHAFATGSPELYDRLHSQVDDELKRLASAIPEATPEHTLIAMVKAHSQLEARRARALNVSAGQVAAAESALTEAENRMQVHQRLLQSVKAEHERCASEKTTLQRPQIELPDICDSVGDTRSDFQTYLHRCQAAIINAEASYFTSLLECHPGFDAPPPIADLVSEDAMSEIRATLAGYEYDDYDEPLLDFFGITDYPALRITDRGLCRIAAAVAAKAVLAQMKDVRDETVASIKEVRAVRLRESEQRMNEEAQLVEDLRRKLEAAHHEFERRKALHDEYEANSRRDLENARGFRFALLRSLDASANAQVATVRDPSVDAASRVQVALSVLLATTRARSMNIWPNEET